MQDMDSTQLALLLVDVQRDFWGPLQSELRFTSFPTNVRTLLATARANHLSVVHTQAVFRADHSDWMLFYGPHGRGPIPCIVGTGGEEIEEFAAPHGDEPVIHKQGFDGFASTDLERVLRERNIKALLIAGLVTSVCVLFTATAAYLRRFVPLIVTDACADSPSKHEATLGTYTGLCFQGVTTAQVQHDLASVVQLAGRFANSS
jgi:nicotinamidase-related amidase